jgi:DNA-binding response OmpR family regulator
MELAAILNSTIILILEDEPFQRRLLCEVLKNAGFRWIEGAESGVAAESLLQNELIDVVLSDLEVPGLNGLELLRHIRTGQTQAPRDTRFIILTSHSDSEVLGAALALDVNGFIVKPFKMRLILDRITRALSEPMMLRSEGDYGSVVTDLESLRRARDASRHKQADDLRTATTRAEIQRRTIIVPVAQLRAGMRLAQSLTAIDGSVVVAAETILTEAIIKLVSDLQVLLGDQVVIIDGSDPWI